MSELCFINKSKLSDIADALRRRTGETALMTAAEMAQKIDELPSGGQQVVDDMVKGVLESFTSSVNSIRNYGFYYHKSIKSVVLSDASSIGYYAFMGSTLESIRADKATFIGHDAFNNTLLTSVAFPLLGEVTNYLFKGSALLTTVDLPKVTKVGTSAFINCAELQSVYLRSSGSMNLSAACFDGAKMTRLVIGNPASTAAAMAGGNTFRNSSVADGTGFVYVPDHLIAAYKGAMYWKNYADQIKGQSELPSGWDAELLPVT